MNSYFKRRIYNIIFYFLPNVLKKKVLYKKQEKFVIISKQKYKTIVNIEYLRNIFNLIELNNDVFVHTSITSIGKIEGGYKEVVKLLNKHIVQKEQTLLLSALPFKGSSEEYIKTLKVFDVRIAPIEMGVINEYFGSMKDTYRSLSPTHSVIALGVNAEEYTSFHHLSEVPFDQNSPYFKLIRNKGKVLMFGAELKHLTLVHVVEDLLGNDFPCKIYTKKKYLIELKDKNGNIDLRYFKAHSAFRGIFRNTEPILDLLRALPSTKIFPIGCSELILLDAIDVVICLLQSLQNGLSAYGKVRLSKKAIEKTEYWIDFFKSL